MCDNPACVCVFWVVTIHCHAQEGCTGFSTAAEWEETRVRSSVLSVVGLMGHPVRRVIGLTWQVIFPSGLARQLVGGSHYSSIWCLVGQLFSA